MKILALDRLTRAGLTLGCLLAFNAQAGDWNTNSDNVVLDGHDVVAYHSDAKAVRGSNQYQVTHDGAKFYFRDKKNLGLFTASPAKYLPKYNGYCAFAVSAKNAKVPANADTFKIYNGELMVFFNDDFEGQKFNTKVPWNADEKNMYVNAEKNWPTLK